MIAAGKVALVTGGASGMGQIFARRLAASGAKVAIFDVNEAGLRQTADADNITAFHCDIADQEEVTARVAEVEADLGPVELLVHAAALMPAYALADHSHENMEKLFRVNFFGTTYLCRAVLPGMQARRHGRIIVFGSIAGVALVPKMGGYCATKAAVNAYTEVLQNEIRDTGVRVHLVCPPAVDTPLMEQTLNTDSPGSIKEAREKGRLAQPDRIIDAIENGVARDRDIIYPGQAKWLYRWRTLAPGLWWKTVMNFEK